MQSALLSPALALLLVSLYDLSAAGVGGVLAVYNASGFVASLVVPALADRRRDYLGPMLVAGLLTLLLALLLALSSSLGVAVVALVVLGGPAGVGVSLLYAHLRHSGASRVDIVDTRAIFSFAWVAGPPLASLVISGFGARALLLVIAAVSVLNVATTAAMMSRRARAARRGDDPPAPLDEGRAMRRSAVALVVSAFVVLQATNSAAVSVMTLFVTRRLDLDVVWAGVALSVAAALEIPALLLIGRLGTRFSDIALIASGCVAGAAYYSLMAAVHGPWLLVSGQALNAWFVAAVAGVGLSLFQRVIPRPGVASGLYANTRRLGAIGSGPVLALGSATSLGYSFVFVACAALTALALLVLGSAAALD
nr:MFS transporter [Motilibacter peucedani]